jgi:hypothetical protein
MSLVADFASSDCARWLSVVSSSYPTDGSRGIAASRAFRSRDVHDMDVRTGQSTTTTRTTVKPYSGGGDDDWVYSGFTNWITFLWTVSGQEGSVVIVGS